MTLMNAMHIHVILLPLAPTLMVVLNVLVLLVTLVTVFLVTMLMNALLEPITAVAMDPVQIPRVALTANVIVDTKVMVSNVPMSMSAATHLVTSTHTVPIPMEVSPVSATMVSAVVSKVLAMMSTNVTKILVTLMPHVTISLVHSNALVTTVTLAMVSTVMM